MTNREKVILTAIIVAVAAPASEASADCPPVSPQEQPPARFAEATASSSAIALGSAANGALETMQPRDPANLLVNPLAIEYGGGVAIDSLVFQKSHIEALSADRAQALEYIGNRAVNAAREPLSA